MEDCSVLSVLMLKASARTRLMIDCLPSDVSKAYKFVFHSPVSHNPTVVTSLQDYFDDVKEVIVREKIDLVLSTGDNGALLRAALTQEFPHLRGPSVESVFLCYNEYYTRCFLDPHPIPFACLDLSASDLDQACEEALQKVGVPAFFKPSCMSLSRCIASIASTQELKDFVKSYNSSGVSRMKKVDTAFMNPFYASNIDEQKYPLANRPTAIVERHMGQATHVNADGYAFDGKIYHWSIGDSLMSQSKPCYYFGCAYPTSLPEDVQRKVWELFDAVMGKMIEFGFNYTFANVEVFVLDSGDVKLIEVNPRYGGNLQVSRMVFTNGDILEARLKLAQGINPGVPTPNGRHGLYSYIRTCGCGRTKELYDYSYSLPGLVPEADPESLIDGSGESGAVVGRISLSGDSREEVMEKYRSVCRQVLLKPELSVWQ